MLYVVVRDIEDSVRYDVTVFLIPDEARAYYERAAIICDNDPDEFGEGDVPASVETFLAALPALSL
jgi:hypothetical protein